MWVVLSLLRIAVCEHNGRENEGDIPVFAVIDGQSRDGNVQLQLLSDSNNGRYCSLKKWELAASCRHEETIGAHHVRLLLQPLCRISRLRPMIKQACRARLAKLEISTAEIQHARSPHVTWTKLICPFRMHRRLRERPTTHNASWTPN